MSGSAPTPCVVLRANDCCFTGILRSCEAAGVPVIPVVFDWAGAGPWHGECSRWYRGACVIPNPHEHPAAAVTALLGLGEKLVRQFGERPLFVPSSDTVMMFTIDHAAELGLWFRYLGSVDFEHSRLDVVQKHTCAELLRAGDVPIPHTVACLDPADIARAADVMAFPCVYKPVVKDYGQSFYRAHGGAKAVSCVDAAELRARLPSELEQGFRLVVQERLEFDSATQEIPFYLYSDRDFEVRLAATAVKEQIQPAPFGTATELRLTWHEELLPIARRVVRALRWRGILMIEFLRDRKDGVWKVVEVNGRPWLFIDFFRRFGVDFFAELRDDLAGLPFTGQTRTPAPDVLALEPLHVELSTAVRPKISQGAGCRNVAAYLDDLRGARTTTMWDPRDPGPGESELKTLADECHLSFEELRECVTSRLADR